MRVWLSALLALGSAAMFGVSSVLQQAAAQQEADLPLVGVRVLARLVHRPRWLAAVSLAGLSFGVQALALAFGPLTLVQPLAATDLLFALPFLAHRQRRRPRRREWSAAALVAGGIAGFLVLLPRSPGLATPGLTDWLWVLSAVGATVAVMVPVALASGTVVRTALLAGAGAVVFGLGDALTKAVVGLTGDRGIAVLWTWEPYALLVAGIGGMVLAQGAYRAGPLLTSLPIIDSVEPVVAVLVGATVFAEPLGESPAVLSAQLFAAAVAVVGIVLLGRSPFMARAGPREERHSSRR